MFVRGARLMYDFVLMIAWIVELAARLMLKMLVVVMVKIVAISMVVKVVMLKMVVTETMVLMVLMMMM